MTEDELLAMLKAECATTADAMKLVMSFAYALGKGAGERGDTEPDQEDVAALQALCRAFFADTERRFAERMAQKVPRPHGSN